MEQTTDEVKKVTRGLQSTGESPNYQAPKSYPFPTEVISLPSKGLCYPESNPLSKGEITIKLMTAKEEDILTSTNLIRKGIQLDKLLESIVVEPGVNINDLIIQYKEKDVLKLLNFVTNVKDKDIFISKYYENLTKRLMTNFSGSSSCLIPENKSKFFEYLQIEKTPYSNTIYWKPDSQRKIYPTDHHC
jgi:hypothetical protein